MDSRDTLLDEDVRRCNDEQLIAGLRQTLRKQRGMTARLVAFIAEVDARRLYRDQAHSSMFSYAVHELHMGEDEAYIASPLPAPVALIPWCSACWPAASSI